MNRVEDIIHAENIAALVLAIVSDEPLSPEDAFRKLKNPKAMRRTKTRDTILLRDAGCSWQEVRELIGISDPNCLYCKAKKQLKTNPKHNT